MTLRFYGPILISLISFISLPAFSQFYAGFSGELNRYASQELSQARGGIATGFGFSLQGGIRIDSFSLESGLIRLNAETDEMYHGSERYIYNVKTNSIPLWAKLHIESFYLKLGFIFHHLNRRLLGVSSTSTGVTGHPLYPYTGKKWERGLAFGAGFEFPKDGNVRGFSDLSYMGIDDYTQDFMSLGIGLRVFF